jgi:guanylate kinase
MSSDSPDRGSADPDRPERGCLIVVSAPSGAGKSSLVQLALQRTDGLRFSVSFTTRAPRPGETMGVDYFFVSEDEFVRMRENDEFLECAEVHGNLYGTHRETVEKALSSGLDIILDIDVQGAEQVRRNVVDAATVFILPPSLEVLEARLRLRNLNTPADLARRMRTASIEVQLYYLFDYVIVNDDLDRASAELEAIIVAERHRPRRNSNKIERIIETFGGK